MKPKYCKYAQSIEFVQLRDANAGENKVKKIYMNMISSSSASAISSSSESSEDVIQDKLDSDTPFLRADWMVKNNKVFHNTTQKVFTVENECGTTYMVKLGNNESCTCVAKANCCHILASKISVGK